MGYTPYTPVPTMTMLAAQWRARTMPALRGDVLDIGTGEGDSLPPVTTALRLTCLEPRRSPVQHLRERFAHRAEVRVLHAAAESIPLPDVSMDAVTCSYSLCSVANQRRALVEIRRVLRPGGRLFVLEHVAAPRGTWLRLAQRATAPLSRWLDHGCDPARDTGTSLAGSGLAVVDLRRRSARGTGGLAIPHLVGVLVREPGAAWS